MSRKYTANFSWGARKRISQNRIYTHAYSIIATANIPDWWGKSRIPGTDGHHVAGTGFAGSEALARKAADSFLSGVRRWKSPPVAHAEIVPVEVVS